ncbi:MAG: hypothetical protein C4320_04290, partial [Armatimonadota bacterium]
MLLIWQSLPPLEPGMVLTQSKRLDRHDFQLSARGAATQQAAVIVRGNGITIDFNGSTMRGATAAIDPDQFLGTGILVEGNNITIKNANIHGYKVAIHARNCRNLKLIDCDLSYNWRQRLKSTREKEDLEDWMSYHQNEKNEWLRYGAAVYLEGCSRPEVRGVRVTGGQNAVMMTRTDDGLVWNCNLSYNSSIGIGLYRSSRNRIMHNAINFCVRGHSEGVYNRGQDSAAILVYEQSNRNTFAYNSATHSGDGFFLWAGQTTMDTGQGGCDDNLVYGNDFSYAPTNGIEATFSRNTFANNRVHGCWHGVWGGYSHDTRIVGNEFAANVVDIAIEHGRRIAIEENRMMGASSAAIHLWQNAKQDPNWGYPKHQETDSVDTRIVGNSIGANGLHFDFNGAKRVTIERNRLYDARARVQGETSGLIFRQNRVLGQVVGLPVEGNELDERPYQTTEWSWNPYLGLKDGRQDLARGERTTLAALQPKPLKGGKWPFRWEKMASGVNPRAEIRMTEWGPYDQRSPLLWPSMKADVEGREKFALFGPKGTYRVVSSRGVHLSAMKGAVPGSLMVTRVAEEPRRELVLEYVGKETTDMRGVVTPAGKPVRMTWSEFAPTMAWSVSFAKWDPATQDPRKVPVDDLFRKPLLAITTEKLDYAGYGRFAPGVPADHFVTRADGTFTVPK